MGFAYISVADKDGVTMKDIRKSIEDNYLTFIAAAAGAVTLIACAVWALTYFVKKVKNNSGSEKA